MLRSASLQVPHRIRRTALCDVSSLVTPGYPLWRVVSDNDGTERAQCQSSQRRVANIELPGATIRQAIKGIPLQLLGRTAYCAERNKMPESVSPLVCAGNKSAARGV